jgi:hypothetical protein
MGDLIEVKDTFIIQLQRRMSDKKSDVFELCMIYPECMDHDNVVFWFKDEINAYTELRDIVKSIVEREL